MPTKTLFMETTEIAPEKSAGEITTLLVQSGAREISMQYADGKLTGLRFVLLVKEFPISFVLPVRTESIYKILVARSRSSWPSDKEKKMKQTQAERVAWRQLLRWVQAQLAMIDTGMVQAHEVFLPYILHAGSGQTLFEYFQKDGLKQLAAGNKQ